jgi:hypothetical protein
MPTPSTFIVPVRFFLCVVDTVIVCIVINVLLVGFYVVIVPAAWIVGRINT